MAVSLLVEETGVNQTLTHVTLCYTIHPTLFPTQVNNMTRDLTHILYRFCKIWKMKDFNIYNRLFEICVQYYVLHPIILLFVCAFCFAPEIGTITVNSELDSASNDIYFLNMQLFPW
jgi:hypothetical protein